MAGRNGWSAEWVLYGTCRCYMGGMIGDCSEEWADIVEGSKVNLCYYEET